MTLARLVPKQEEFTINNVRWFKEPEPGNYYLAALDPSFGTGGDFAAIQVFEFPSMYQVAEWKHNKTDVTGQVATLMKILQYIDYQLGDGDNYDSIYWTVENNSLGEAALQIISQTGEDNFPGMFMSEPLKTRTGKSRKGLNTNSKTKPIACFKLKSLMESNRMTVNSHALIKELKNFVASGNSFKAKQGEHDDLTMAAITAIRLASIIMTWDDSFVQMLGDSVEDSDMESMQPMPMVFG